MTISKPINPTIRETPACERRRESVPRLSTRLLIGTALLFGSVALANGQQSASPPASVKHLVGFENAKPNAKGELTIEGSVLEFRTRKAKADVSIASVEEVFTEQDFKQLIGGTTGTLAKMAIPYGGGRVLSLFQEKIDVLTLEYHDASGGLHGAIFTLPKGQAPPIKRQLVARGAHATIVPDEPANSGEKKP